MDALPPQKFQPRPWRFGRKRRRSGTEATESEGTILSQSLWLIYLHKTETNDRNGVSIFLGDSKLVKKEEGEKMETTAAVPPAPAAAATANGTPAKVTGDSLQYIDYTSVTVSS